MTTSDSDGPQNRCELTGVSNLKGLAAQGAGSQARLIEIETVDEIRLEGNEDPGEILALERQRSTDRFGARVASVLQERLQIELDSALYRPRVATALDERIRLHVLEKFSQHWHDDDPGALAACEDSRKVMVQHLIGLSPGQCLADCLDLGSLSAVVTSILLTDAQMLSTTQHERAQELMVLVDRFHHLHRCGALSMVWDAEGVKLLEQTLRVLSGEQGRA